MKKNLYYIFYIGVLMMFLAGCQDEGLFTSADDEPVNVSYRVKVEDGLQSRAIGDAPQVNNLSVLVFDEKDNLVLSQRNLAWSEVQSNGLSLPLFKGTYKVLFWLQYADDNLKPYTIADNGQVSVSYNGWTGNINDVEKWDAFYLVDSLKISNAVQNKPVTLTRPVGQLNWAAQDGFNTSEHQVVVTLSNVATTFHPFNEGANTQDLAENEITFTFNGFTTETLNTDEGAYTYLTCNYLFPATFTATFDLQKNDGTSVKKVENLNDIKIEKNKRTNVLGSIVQEPEAPTGWDGVTLTQPKLVEGHYIIDEPSKLAWLTSGKNNLTEAATFLVTENLDMASKEIASVKLPGGSTFDGGSKTIKNFANSLFGNATNLTVQNLFLDNVQATSNGHVGVLVNTLKGNGTFTNVSVSNSSATTEDGAAGGMVGYIRRIKETTASDVRTESLEVTFSNCNLAVVTANGTQSEGKFVGLLSGYDNDETLSFDANCSATNITLDYESPYKKENQSVWLFIEAEDGSKENNFSDETYDGWLGTETYRRGNVTFEGKRLVPKWDGNTSIDPIVENNVKLIYSPYDLATLQGGTPASIEFMTSVDMAGNTFTPIITLKNLTGNSNTLYNLKVDTMQDEGNSYGGAFIRNTGGGTHQDLTIDNADIKVVHDPNGSTGNAYGGILAASVSSTHTMSNIHIKNSKLYAVCKMGGLVGRVHGGTFTCTGCTIDNCTLENYNAKDDDVFDISGEMGSITATAHAVFGTAGEAGGLIGFLCTSANITNCSVSKTTINCFGQRDQEIKINATLTGSSVGTHGYYLVAGRHVNEFIGDIRTIYTNTNITINGCKLNNNTYGTNSTQGDNGHLSNQHNCHFYSFTRRNTYTKVSSVWIIDSNITFVYDVKASTPFVGCIYYVGIDDEILGKTIRYGDVRGKVTIDDLVIDAIDEFVGGPLNNIADNGIKSANLTQIKYPSNAIIINNAK